MRLRDWLFTLVLAGLFAVMLLFLPACSPGPPPPPTPTPPVACVCSVPGRSANGWQAVDLEDAPPYGAIFLSQARMEIGDRCGRDLTETLVLVAGAVHAQHVCADAPWGAEVLLARPDGLWESWDVVQSDGCWRSLDQAFKGAWKNSEAMGCLR